MCEKVGDDMKGKWRVLGWSTPPFSKDVARYVAQEFDFRTFEREFTSGFCCFKATSYCRSNQDSIICWDYDEEVKCAF